MRVAPNLADLRGDVWRQLVLRASAAPSTSPTQLAFSLLLIRMNGCLTCHTDCYRAMRGCTLCAVTAVRRFRGPDEELVAMFDQALVEVEGYLQGEQPALIEVVYD